EPVSTEKAPAPPPPPPAAAEPAQEIDISNEWEDMIEVETDAEAEPVKAEPLLQPVHEPVTEIPVVPVEPEPVAAPEPEVDLAAQVSEKVQEIRFYITQEMWEPAKAAILDLTELAPDTPEVTELIAAVTAGQTKAAPPPPPPPMEEVAPVVIE